MSDGGSASLPDNDDILREILLRLPPLPSSLPRASLVSKRWGRLVSDPQFLRRFRAHHCTPPLLGFFAYIEGYLKFTPTLDRPDRIPPERFSLLPRPGQTFSFVGCRHGLALLLDWPRHEAIVWNPVTGRQQCVSFPAELKTFTENTSYHGAVLGSANDADGDCHLEKLVLVRTSDRDRIASACLYDSKSGKWGNISSTTVAYSDNLYEPAVLVGSALYWLHSRSRDILEFDLDRQALAVIQKPEDTGPNYLSSFQVLRTHENRLGLAILTEHTIQLLVREANMDGVVKWVLLKTVDLDKLLSLTAATRNSCPSTIIGFDEDNNVIFLLGLFSVMINLETMQFTRILLDTGVFFCYPYTSFYPAVHGEDD